MRTKTSEPAVIAIPRPIPNVRLRDQHFDGKQWILSAKVLVQILKKEWIQ